MTWMKMLKFKLKNSKEIEAFSFKNQADEMKKRVDVENASILSENEKLSCEIKSIKIKLKISVIYKEKKILRYVKFFKVFTKNAVKHTTRNRSRFSGYSTN